MSHRSYDVELSATRLQRLLAFHATSFASTLNGINGGNKANSRCSSLYAAILALHTEKGGDISRLVSWRLLNASGSRTLWRHDIMLRLEAHLIPKFEARLKAKPSQVGQACDNGATPLHISASMGLAQFAALLLTHGASPSARTAGGRTALDEAMYNGNHEVVKLLLPALPRAEQEVARSSLASYMALPDASLRADMLHDVGLPPIVRRAARVDHAGGASHHSSWSAARRLGGGAHGAENGDDCGHGGGWVTQPYQPVPLASSAFGQEAPPTIDIRVDLSEEEYYKEYFLKGRPVLIRNAVPRSERCRLAALQPDMRDAVTTQMRCGATAYPELTGRRPCSEAFDFLKLRDNPRCTDALKTRPVCNYKLGKQRTSASSASASAASQRHDAAVNQTAGFRSMPASLRHTAELPPLRMMRRSWSVATSRALWGGTAWSGSGYHYHNPAYNLLFFGTKQWMIAPPRFSGISDVDSLEWPDPASKAKLPEGLPLRFTQRAGDLVVVPAQWGHSTLSSGGFTLGLGVLWCDTRWMNLSVGDCHLHQQAWKSQAPRS